MSNPKFSEQQISELRAQYSAIETINPESPMWQALEKYVQGLAKPMLRQLEQADIKWVSGLARLNLASLGAL